jgi:MoxR-like ATPase
MRRGTGAPPAPPEPVLAGEEITALQQAIRHMPVADHVYAYAERLVRSTRPKLPEALDFCRKWLTWGAGPRASLNLILAARARAMLRGQVFVGTADIAAVATPILRHRLGLNFSAQSDGVTADDIVRKILETLPAQ